MNLYKAYSSFAQHTIFFLEDGSSVCFPEDTGPFPFPTDTITSIAIGWKHTLVLLKDGQLFAWGGNYFGQLGLPTSDIGDVLTPTLVPLSKTHTLIEVRAGASFSAALTLEGSLFLWGSNNDSQLGIPASQIGFTSSPVEVTLPLPIQAFDCGWNHVLALTCDGSLYVWGRNKEGCLGLGDALQRETPTPNPIPDLAAIVAGNNCSFFVTKSGALLATGWNNHGNLGTGDWQNCKTPEVVFSEGVEAVAAGGSHTLVLMKDGRVYGWGWNEQGQAGTGGNEKEVLKPSLVAGIWETSEKNSTKDPEQYHKSNSEKGKFTKIFKRQKKSNPLVGTKTSRTMSFGCGWFFSFIALEDQSLFLWGAEAGGSSTESRLPVLQPWKVQSSRVGGWEEWARVFLWVLKGRRDTVSLFYDLPVEVVWNMVQIVYRK
jgi:alpha-tubulin suppressor-like RCC1 family protein